MCGLAKEQQFAERAFKTKFNISKFFLLVSLCFERVSAVVQPSRAESSSLPKSFVTYLRNSPQQRSNATTQRNAMPAAAAASSPSSSRRCCQLEVSKRWRHSCKQSSPRLASAENQNKPKPATWCERQCKNLFRLQTRLFTWAKRERESNKWVGESELHSERARAHVLPLLLSLSLPLPLQFVHLVKFKCGESCSPLSHSLALPL